MLSNGVHTDFVLPVRAAGVDWAAQLELERLHGTNSGLEWVAVGWGDRRFCLETPTFVDLRWDTALGAISGTGRTAMHVTWPDGGPRSDDDARALVLSEARYLALCEYVQASLAVDDAKRPRLIAHPG